MVKKTVTTTTERTYCDFCGKELWLDPAAKCIGCGKDICDKCDTTHEILYRDIRTRLCPDCYPTISLKEFAERAEKRRAED